MGSSPTRILQQIVALSSLCLLAGCNQSSRLAVNDSRENKDISGSYLYEAENFLITIPSDYADEHKTGNSIFFGYAEDSKTGDSMIAIESLSSVCSPQLDSISEPHQLDNFTSWGKVDPVGPFVLPPPICQPPILNEHENPDPLETGSREYGAAYALCSEKNGKTVIVCVTQVKDNSEIAQKIFESFRWTE